MGNTESSQSARESPGLVPAAAASSSSAMASEDDEPWWHEIEHENLILEQLPAAAKVEKNSSTTKMEKEQLEEAAGTGETSNQSLDEFKEELASKRLARQTALQDMKEEISRLRQELSQEKAENRRLRQDTGVAPAEEMELETQSAEDLDPDDENPRSRSRHANIELANAQLALQLANADNLSLRSEVDVVQRQVGTLKEVICCCKQMLSVKEEQCAQLKLKLQEIENSFSEREMKIMSNNLRQEYERQLVNIRQLRQLYEERQRVAAAEYENLQRLISIKKDELQAEQEKTKSYEERNQLLLKELETAQQELAKLREECVEHKYEQRVLKEQVGAVNLLFSQLVMGNGRNNMDIDRLTQMLEENRDLLNEMTQAEGSCSDGASLPKLLFELVEQATQSGQPAQLENDEKKSRSASPELATSQGKDMLDSGRTRQHHQQQQQQKRHCAVTATAAAASLKSHEPEIMGKVAPTAQEIIGNLPKVWKVLMELLSHHKIERVQFEELPAAGEDSHNPAEGTQATATGAAAVGKGIGTDAGGAKVPELSVSKTYIKLKDLIMEKKSLVKETNRLKTLNCHLDFRLNEQEKRLSAVSLELTKTWHLVGKMQRQHRQLHTQEQILRYQLQQKKRLLGELKDELEYCRRKWAAARVINDESQEQCNDWRREFARRKLEDANHSAESGYSDSGPQSDEDTTAGEKASAPAADVVDIEAAAAPSSHCRRKHLRDQFEHTRKIKRMQSTSPGRQAAAGVTGEDDAEEIVLRWNSAPPTCGWREGGDYELEEESLEDEDSSSRGAVPKTIHSSRNRQRGKVSTPDSSSPAPADVGTFIRIQKLEEQCKSLIQQVLETTGNRERLEVQLCRFQDEISPAQHAVPLEEFINRKRLERMTRASSAPATGSLTPREEEYTRKRSERLGRLEEESRQLLSRIKRTTDRGHYLKKSLDRIRRAPSREGSFESNTEEEPKVEAVREEPTKSPLTAEEEAYTSRRAARLQRMEQESQQLLSQLSRHTEQASTVASISQTVEQRLEDIERVSANRAERLRRLEEQGNELIARLSNTSERGTAMINRIAEREASRRQEAELLEQAQNTEETSDSLDNNVAFLVEEDNEAAACCVTVTTTSSQLALKQSTGAIPKTSLSQIPVRSKSKLCAAVRHDDATRKRTISEQDKANETPLAEGESLEHMVQRLRSLPFPGQIEQAETQKSSQEEEQEREHQSSGEQKNELELLLLLQKEQDEGNKLCEEQETEQHSSGEQNNEQKMKEQNQNQEQGRENEQVKELEQEQ